MSCWALSRVTVLIRELLMIFLLILIHAIYVFTALHCMEASLRDRKRVRLSITRVNCDKTKAPSEKSSIMTTGNRKSTTSFPMSLR